MSSLPLILKIARGSQLALIAIAILLLVTRITSLHLPLRLLSLSCIYKFLKGWRIGWACAPSSIATAIRNIHINITDSAPAPFQEAALTALRCSPEYLNSLRTSYELRRNYAAEMLSVLGFQLQFKPQGSFFLFAELPESWLHSDVDFVRELIEKGGVAAVPGCGFFHNSSNSQSKYYNRFVRFAFCKSEEILGAAAQRIRELELKGAEGLIQKILN